MVLLKDWRTYWTNLIKVVVNEQTAKPLINSVHLVTDEGDIQDKIQDIKNNELPFLLVVTPSAKSQGSTADSFTESDLCLIYVLDKEDAHNRTTFELQEELQPVLEALKSQLLEDKDGCGIMRTLDVGSFQTDPEKKLFSKLTGWSLSFNL